jgi:putative OPT family oligopeptide transporter
MVTRSLTPSPVQFTVRAVLTGIIIGAILTPCNVYSGLKIGWSFNMSIIAALLGYAFWKVFADLFKTSPWSLEENTYNQTAASASASIISGGLVAPIPAYTIITGQSLPMPILIAWVFMVSLLGIIVAVGLRRQLLIHDNIPFPSGIATAETLTDLHAKNKDSLDKIAALFSAGTLSFGAKLFSDLYFKLPQLQLFKPFSSLYASLSGLKSYGLKQAGFVLDPSLLLLGFGMIIGSRAGISLLIGAAISWLILPPYILNSGALAPVDPGQVNWFTHLVTWTLWPGVGMMVVASLTSFGIGIIKLLGKRHWEHEQPSSQEAKITENPTTDKKHPLLFAASIGITLVVLTFAQHQIFQITLFMGAFAVLVSMLLGIVSSRVSGETGIAPIGALGKVTQLGFGLMNPGHIASNLMTANVTGGAAGQSSDLLHDLKAGLLLKIDYRYQIAAQVFGIMIGALVGSLVYVFLIPDPQTQLLTPEWPAPAVATWKSVAELMAKGMAHFPNGALEALVIASIIGFALSVLEQTAPLKWRSYIPSASAMGLAFIIPASSSLTMFSGALLAFLLKRLNKNTAKRFSLVIAAGLVAGESMGGVVSIAIKALFP